MLYETEPFTLAHNEVYTLASEVDSFAIISATYGDYLEISTGNGQGFFPFPADGSLEFPVPTVVRIKNTNALANTIIVGSGSAKFRRNLSNGGVVTISGTVAVTVPVGQQAMAASTPVVIASNQSAVPVSDAALSAKFGPLNKTPFSLDAAGTTNDTLIAAGARRLASVDIFNAAAYPIYLRLYDKVTAPVVGTDIAKRVFAIPTLTNVHIVWGDGDSYLVGLGLGLTKNPAYNDATAVADHDAQIVLNYD